jgi:hypothetical protein
VQYGRIFTTHKKKSGEHKTSRQAGEHASARHAQTRECDKFEVACMLRPRRGAAKQGVHIAQQYVQQYKHMTRSFYFTQSQYTGTLKKTDVEVIIHDWDYIDTETNNKHYLWNIRTRRKTAGG